MYHADLSRKSDLAEGPDFRAVGWLQSGMPFSTGSVPTSFREALETHLAEAVQRVIFFGQHECDLCATDAPREHRNFFIPAGSLLYIAPAMIAHYIDAHAYKPPEEFIAAVEQCPQQSSPEFEAALDSFSHLWRRG